MFNKGIKILSILIILCTVFSGCYGEYVFFDEENVNDTFNVSSKLSTDSNENSSGSNVTNNTTEINSTVSDESSVDSAPSQNSSVDLISSEVSSVVSTPSKPVVSSSPSVSEVVSSEQERIEINSPVELTPHMQEVLHTTFLRLLNEERKEKGLLPLTIDEITQTTAILRVQETTIQFSHTRPNGEGFYTAFPKDFHYSSCGENITLSTYGIKASDFDLSDNGLIKMATKAFANFKNSASHYENLLKSEYNYTGIGFCTGYYVTQDNIKLVAVFCANIFVSK